MILKASKANIIGNPKIKRYFCPKYDFYHILVYTKVIFLTNLINQLLYIMKTLKTLKTLSLFFALLIFSCGGEETKKESSKIKLKTTEKKAEVKKTTTKASETIDLTNKGVGPVKSVALGATINQAMATQGAEIYKKMCTACHKPDKKFIGPAPKGIMKRRAPEWIMNIILDPEGMVKNDPLAKALLIEFNGSPMANQNLTQEEARAVLEYFRTL
jgi:mono/diheme cytochrome c family protein